MRANIYFHQPPQPPGTQSVREPQTSPPAPLSKQRSPVNPLFSGLRNSGHQGRSQLKTKKASSADALSPANQYTTPPILCKVRDGLVVGQLEFLVRDTIAQKFKLTHYRRAV